jgi:hypothetical protein
MSLKSRCAPTAPRRPRRRSTTGAHSNPPPIPAESTGTPMTTRDGRITSPNKPVLQNKKRPPYGERFVVYEDFLKPRP